MLVALEALEFEELQEAARYFEQTSAPGHELLPRREHERLFLERAASEGREPAARRFLVTLNRMAAAAHGTKPQRRTAERPNETRRTRPEAGAATDPGRGTSGQEYVAEGEDRAPTAADLARVSAAAGGRGPRRFALPPSVDESGLLKSGAGAPGEAYGEEEDGEEGQWEQVSKRRNKSSRRRRLWPAGSGGPASAPSDEAPNDSLLDLDPELKRIEDGGVAFDIEPPQIEREPSPRSAFEAVTRGRSNAPLPTWTSWAEDVEEEEQAQAAKKQLELEEAASAEKDKIVVRVALDEKKVESNNEGGGEEDAPAAGEVRRKKKKAPPPSFLPLSPQSTSPNSKGDHEGFKKDAAAKEAAAAGGAGGGATKPPSPPNKAAIALAAKEVAAAAAVARRRPTSCRGEWW